MPLDLPFRGRDPESILIRSTSSNRDAPAFTGFLFIARNTERRRSPTRRPAPTSTATTPSPQVPRRSQKISCCGQHLPWKPENRRDKAPVVIGSDNPLCGSRPAAPLSSADSPQILSRLRKAFTAPAKPKTNARPSYRELLGNLSRSGPLNESLAFSPTACGCAASPLCKGARPLPKKEKKVHADISPKSSARSRRFLSPAPLPRPLRVRFFGPLCRARPALCKSETTKYDFSYINNTTPQRSATSAHRSSLTLPKSAPVRISRFIHRFASRKA